MSILVPLGRITDSPFQTRHTYDDERIKQLADSIEKDGLIQVPVGRLVGRNGQRFHIAADCLSNQEEITTLLEENAEWHVQLAVGHNRLRAFRHLGQESMPIELRLLTDEQMDMLAWQENHQRNDLDPIERARAIKDRIERHGWTHEKAAEQLGVGRSTVSNALRLLKLPDEVIDHVRSGKLSERQASALAPAYDVSDEDLAFAKDHLQYRYTFPDQLLKGALNNHWTSDDIRKTVDRNRNDLRDERDRQAKLEESRKQLIEQAAGTEGETKVLTKREIGYGTYTDVSDKKKDYYYVPGCTPECPCRTQVIGYTGELEWVCVDPKRHQSLKAKATKEAKKKRKAARERKLSAFLEKLNTGWSPQAIRAIVQAAANGRTSAEDFREAVELLGVDKALGGLGTYDKQESAKKAIENLDMDTALQFALVSLVVCELRNEVEGNNYVGTEAYDLVMRGQPYPDEACEYCGEEECDRTCTTAMVEDGAFDEEDDRPEGGEGYVECDNCGMTLEAAGVYTRRGRHFCDKDCFAEWKEIEEAEESQQTGDDVRSCRVCGCTDDDCGQCIEKTGEPCAWMPGLETDEGPICSACVDVEDSDSPYAGDDDPEWQPGFNETEWDDRETVMPGDEHYYAPAPDPNWTPQADDVRAQTSESTNSVDLARLRQRFKEATSWMGLANYHIVARKVIDDTLEELEAIDEELATLAASEEDDELAVDVATYRAMLLEDLARRERENAEIMEAN